MSDRQPSLEPLHAHLAGKPQIATDLEHVVPDCIFFALQKHDSHSRFAAVLWRAWGLLEFRAGPVLLLLDRIAHYLPTPVSSRWQTLRRYRYNGNASAKLALQRGAAFVVMDQGSATDPRVVRVANVRHCLYRFAHEHRMRQRATVIGITGSCGKTTTKEFVAHLLATRLNVVATPASFNTFEGICHTLLKATPATDVVVLEISSAGGNEVEEKARIACPDIAIITVIGKAHLQGFGGIEGVRAVKRKLFDVVMERNGMLIVNQDKPDLVEIAGNYPNVRRFGRTGAVDISGHARADTTPVELVWQEQGGQPQQVTTQLFGAYNADNLLAAITVARTLDIPTDAINAALANYRPNNMRSQLLQCDDVNVILDAYNANPTSVQVALRDFCQMVTGHRTLILGDMLELGAHSASEHRAILSSICALPLDAVYLVGKEFGQVMAGHANRETLSNGQPVHWFPTVAALLERLQREPPRGTTILLKGSRGIALERVLTLWPAAGAGLSSPH